MSTKHNLKLLKSLVETTFAELTQIFSNEENKGLFSFIRCHNDVLKFSLALKEFIMVATYEKENVIFRTKRIISWNTQIVEYLDFPEVDIKINTANEVFMRVSDANSDFGYLDEISLQHHYIRRLIKYADEYIKQ